MLLHARCDRKQWFAKARAFPLENRNGDSEEAANNRHIRTMTKLAEACVTCIRLHSLQPSNGIRVTKTRRTNDCRDDVQFLADMAHRERNRCARGPLMHRKSNELLDDARVLFQLHRAAPAATTVALAAFVIVNE